MSELIRFHFEGGLADDHRMNFYEAARFQYAAARLMVKLAQFRQSGSFVKNITNSSNLAIELVAHSRGSFNINTEDKGSERDKENFLHLPLSDLLAYASERVVEKIQESDMKETFESVSTVRRAKVSVGRDSSRSLDQLVDSVLNADIDLNDLPYPLSDLVLRRVAEISRAERLLLGEGEIQRIDPARSQKLTAMAAPLISDMATALRRSAETLSVVAERDEAVRSVLFLNSDMARDISTAEVDRDITPIMCDIVQFNKDNGWGKLKIESQPGKVFSFSVPSDALAKIRGHLIDQMKRDLVYLQVQFVRDRAGQIKRVIVVNALN